MTLDVLLLPSTALVFTIVFAGVAVFYLGGRDAVPTWFLRLQLLPRASGEITPFRRTIGILVSVGFLALAQLAVVSNLDTRDPFEAVALVVEQLAAAGWLIYLARRLVRVRSRRIHGTDAH